MKGQKCDLYLRHQASVCKQIYCFLSRETLEEDPDKWVVPIQPKN